MSEYPKQTKHSFLPPYRNPHEAQNEEELIKQIAITRHLLVTALADLQKLIKYLEEKEAAKGQRFFIQKYFTDIISYAEQTLNQIPPRMEQ